MIKLERFMEIIAEEIKHFQPEDDLRVYVSRGTLSIVAKNRTPDFIRIVFIKDKD